MWLHNISAWTHVPWHICGVRGQLGAVLFTFMWVLGTWTWAAECAGTSLSLTEPYHSNPMCFSMESDDPSLGACAPPPFGFPKIQGHITPAIWVHLERRESYPAVLVTVWSCSIRENTQEQGIANLQNFGLHGAKFSIRETSLISGRLTSPRNVQSLSTILSIYCGVARSSQTGCLDELCGYWHLPTLSGSCSPHHLPVLTPKRDR